MTDYGPLLDDWASAAGTCFVERDDGPVTYGSVRRNDLEQLVNAAVAAERERWAKLCEALPIIGRTDQEACCFSNALETCAAEIRRA